LTAGDPTGDAPGANDPRGNDPERDDPAGLRAELARLTAELESAQRDLLSEGERKRLLQDELQHRVRNMLAVVRSIFTRSVAASDSLEDMADHFRGRLDLLARYQMTRSIEPAGSADLEMMVHDELQTAQADNDERVSAGGPPVHLPLDVAQLVGLALHELATNSIKFGVLSSTSERAKLFIEWSIDAGTLRICWRETGVSIVSRAPIRFGFGRELIENAMPYQLGAVTEFDASPGKFSCLIELPIEETDRAKRTVRW
jgi:two-component system CheB/CheR fusion protein